MPRVDAHRTQTTAPATSAAVAIAPRSGAESASPAIAPAAAGAPQPIGQSGRVATAGSKVDPIFVAAVKARIAEDMTLNSWDEASSTTPDEVPAHVKSAYEAAVKSVPAGTAEDRVALNVEGNLDGSA